MMTQVLLEGGGFNPIVLTDWSLWFWTAVVFLILLVLLSKFVWRPLMGSIEGRENRIREDLAKAEQARQEAEVLREKHRTEMETAHQQAKAALDEARERAKSLQTELEQKAREEAKNLLEKARVQIEAEKQQALREIKDQVVDLSVAITQRIVQSSSDREDHLREAESLIARIKDLN